LKKIKQAGKAVKPISVEKARISMEDEDEEVVEYGDSGRPMRRAFKAKKGRKDSDENYGDGNDEDHEMDGLEEEESMDVDARGGNGDSDFEVDSHKKKAAKKAKKPKTTAEF